ncbi:zona pellucida glycoprotein d isoform X3 [Perca flavescens]|uniref:zona pellucida glycoprotein d isoform X3 n=1 Tax=Perca flavescens TaxID=8167 RepID=UPI00106E4A0A|nr:uncharacterized protein LOC114560167 isoform X3 [Perca flavescens]
MIQMGLKLRVVLVLLLGFTRQRVDGLCSVQHCNDRTRCVLSKDQRSCKCTIGYYADQCDKNANIKVMCGRDHMAIRATEDFFKYHNVSLESLHFPNKSCRAQREVVDGVPHYMSRISKDQYRTCGGKPLEKNHTHIFYSLSLLSEPRVNGNIVRDPLIKINFTCIHPYVKRASLTFPVIPSSRPTAVPPPLNSETRCVDDQTVSFFNVSAAQSGRNGESSTVRFSFDMFRFLAEPPELYLHCTVQLCEPDDHESCTPNCNSISKREAVRADPTLGLLSYGPIRIEIPDRPQSNILMTVVLPVAGVWTVGFFLIILITVVKASSRRLAKMGEQ